MDLGQEANTRLRTRNEMSGSDRLALYNRQYWFRFVACMQEDYPCAMRLMGVENFNAWAMRYLDAHPSDSPYLADLDRDFYDFMEKEYAGADRGLVLETVRYDKAFDKAFDSADEAPVKLEGLDAASLILAPHATPLRLHWDLGSFRREDRESVARPVDREYAVLIYRHQNTLYEKEISEAAYRLLKELERPRTLAALFESLESSADPGTLNEVEQNLTAWFRDWVELGWICSAAAPQQE